MPLLQSLMLNVAQQVSVLNTYVFPAGMCTQRVYEGQVYSQKVCVLNRYVCPTGVCVRPEQLCAQHVCSTGMCVRRVIIFLDNLILFMKGEL